MCIMPCFEIPAHYAAKILQGLKSKMPRALLKMPRALHSVLGTVLKYSGQYSGIQGIQYSGQDCLLQLWLRNSQFNWVPVILGTSKGAFIPLTMKTF